MLRRFRNPGLVLLLLAQAGCGLLDANTPDIIDPSDLDTPEGAQAKRLGAIADFIFAKDGDGLVTDGQVIVSGLMSDEFVLSTTPPSQQEVDQREIFFDNNETVSSVYLQLHRARRAAEDAVVSLQQFSLDSIDDAGIPEMWALAGYTYVYFGENFCEGVPYSSVNGDQVVFGSSTTRAETFTRALERFDSALASPSLPVDIQYLAQVGRARALLNQGLFAPAAAAVAGVPTNFRYDTEHAESPARLQNPLFTYSDGFLLSVSDQEGTNGLPYRTANDPRVPYEDTGEAGLDGTTPQFTLLKYPDESAPVPVADGIEARLIEAEAQLAAADLSGMNSTLNDLRTNAISPALPDLAVPGTPEEARDQLFSERAFWLFATGHRHADMRRLVTQYGLPINSVFPTGSYVKGGTYGTDVTLPIPLEEDNNPNFDRSLCDTAAP